MSLDDLKSFEPSWRGTPPLPTRIPVESAPPPQPSRMGVIDTSELAEPALPEEYSPPASSDGMNLDMFYAVRFSSSGPPVVTSGYLVSIRRGVVQQILTAHVVNDTTLGASPTWTTGWQPVGDVTEVQCAVGSHTSYTAASGEKLYVACALANYDNS